MTAQEIIQNEYTVIKLDNGEIISRAAFGEHCQSPFVNESRLFYSTCGAKANFIVRNLTTKTETIKDLSQMRAVPSYFGSVNFVTVGFRTFQGLLTYYPKDVIGMLYNMASDAWVIAQVPYRMEQPFPYLFCLKNGSIEPPPINEPGVITKVRAVADGQIDWSQRNENTQDQAVSYSRTSKKMMPDGSVVSVGTPEIVSVNDPNMEVPIWL